MVRPRTWNEGSLMCDRLLDAKAVAELLGCSARQVWKLLASGRLPQSVRLGRSVKWRESDVQRFIGVGCDMNRFDRQSVGAAG